jgi:hypothetical protein
MPFKEVNYNEKLEKSLKENPELERFVEELRKNLSTQIELLENQTNRDSKQ